MIAVLLPTKLWAADGVSEPYAVLTGDTISGMTLTFYYDDQKSARSGMGVGPFNNDREREWHSNANRITEVVFDASMADCTTLTSTAYWLRVCNNLTKVSGMDNLKTSGVTSMRNMFYDCYSLTDVDLTHLNTDNVSNMSEMFTYCRGLTSLDVSSFNTANVTDMSSMFSGCSNLKTIYTESDWNTSKVTNGTFMFFGCNNLVGGKGTVYNGDYSNQEYARIDGGTANPGYFTDKNSIVIATCAQVNAGLEGLTYRVTGRVKRMVSETYGNYYLDDDTDSLFIYGTKDYFGRWPRDNSKLLDGVTEGATITVQGPRRVYKDVPELVDVRLLGNVTLLNVTSPDQTMRKLASNHPTHIFGSSATSAEAKLYLTQDVLNIRVQESARDWLSVVSQSQEGNDATVNFQIGANSGGNRNGIVEFYVNVNGVEYADTLVVLQNGDAPEPYAVLSDNNTVLTFYYDDQKETRGGMSVGPFTYEAARGWNAYMNEITTLVFDDSFANCTSITSTEKWYSGCLNLATINGLKNLNTENITTMNSMFADCRKLTTLDLSHFSTSNVTSMWAMFNNCLSLTELDLSSFNTENVNDTYAMFAGCSALTTIYAGSEWNISKMSADYSRNMFADCTNLKGGAGTVYDANHVDYTYAHIDGGTANPGYFTNKNATPTDEIIQFADANVEAICVKNWDTNGDGALSKKEAAAVTDIGKKFYNNHVITNFNELQYFTGLTVLADSAFKDCTLREVILPQTISTIGNWSFHFCSDLKSILIPSNVATIGPIAFYGCYGLESIKVSEGNSVFDSRDNCNAIIETATNKLRVGCKNTTILDGIVTIGAGAFLDCPFTTNIQFPSSLKTIEQSAFMGSSGLTSLDFNEGLESIDMYAFTYNYDIENIKFPSTLKSLGFDAFHGSKVTHVTIPASVTSIGYAPFISCSRLTEIKVEDGNPNYDSRNNCNAIIRKSSGELIQGCNTTVIPEGVTSISDYSFEDMTSISTIIIPEGVTSIGSTAFYGCSNLRELSIPSTMSTISQNSFRNCNNLETIRCYIEKPFVIGETFQTNEGGNPNVVYERASLYVPYGTKALYEATDVWNKFRNIVEMEPESPKYTFDGNGVLTVYDGTTMADALNAAGGVEEVAKTITAIVWRNNTALTESDLQGFTNPNLLIYVSDMGQVPFTNNVVVNGLAKNVTLRTTIEGNCNFYVPEPFIAERISYGRVFEQSTQISVARGWESIALPFNVQTIEHETKGVIAPFGNNASNKHFWLRRLGGNGLQTATNIEANTPYIISMPNSSDYTADYNLAGAVTFRAQNATVPATVTKATAMADSSIVMLPAMQRVDRSSAVWALNVGEVRGRYLEGSVFERDYRQVRPFEAYTVHRQENSQPAPRYVPIMEISGATGISEMEEVRGEMDDVWYSLDGLKLQGKPKAKGVYIHNGQKIVVR